MLNHKSTHLSVKLVAVAAVLSIILCGCGKNKADIIDKNLVNSEDGFGMDTAKIGELKETKTYSASVKYPITTIIYPPINGVIMQKIEVEYGDEVKKGDLLVSIKPVTDETIAEQEAAIERNKQDIDKAISNYNSQIAALDESIAASTGIDQQILTIQKEKVLRQLEYYQQDSEKTQLNMREDLESLKMLKGDLNIYAPYDGVIDNVENVVEGTELTTTRELLSMHSETHTLLVVSDGDSLKYNMPVTVNAGLREKQETYSGRVVRADNVLDDAYQNNEAYIKLDENVSSDKLKNITVTADVKKLNNVLLVKKFALTTQNNKNYISIIDGDKVMKRPVVAGADDGDYVWILKGVDEGQQVLIQ